MSQLKRNLGITQGIPLALGSILGSGILFLPSLTFKKSGPDVGLVWVLASALCVPLLMMFTRMVKKVGNESGIEGFISHGLGDQIGSTVPFILVGTVIFGMAAAALIVGKFFAALTGIGSLAGILAAAIILVGVGTNLLGVQSTSKVQNLITALLISSGFVLFLMTLGDSRTTIARVTPHFDVPRIFAGVLVAFWAFAGFENLTFLAGEFKNPERDFKISAIVALLVSGLFYLALSFNYAGAVTPSEIDSVLGLYQLAENTTWPLVSTTLVCLFAFFSVQMNYVSWIWGISRLIYSSAGQGKFPQVFASLDKNSVPRNAICLLGSLQLAVLVLYLTVDSVMDAALVAVSGNFVFIYLLCSVSFLRAERVSVLSLFSFLVTLALIAALSSIGWLVLYPVFLVLLSIVYRSFRAQAPRSEH